MDLVLRLDQHDPILLQYVMAEKIQAANLFCDFPTVQVKLSDSIIICPPLFPTC